jgi:hypothetical protein
LSVTSVAERVALAGFVLYAMFAPHSIAGAEIGLAFVALGWLVRFVAQRRTGIRRTPLDLPIWLFFAWTILSAFLSEEPRISLPKLQSVCVLFVFYLAQAVITKRTAVLLVALLILSGVAGSLWSVFEIMHGRGVLVEEVASASPFREAQVAAGDAVWRVGGVRVDSVAEIDEAIRRARAGERLSVSIISQGEHAERAGFIVTVELKTAPAPSGLKGTRRTHRFRPSGWTRHYETFSESLQIIAQLALGLAFANFRKQLRRRWHARLALIACALLSVGIALTAMRTVLVALAIGACVIAWQAARGRARILVALSILVLLSFGALTVWRARAENALELRDHSAALRLSVARNGLARLPLHPFFGHGMDAVKQHWTEWGFPGADMIHLHSTLLQLAFDRGLPALVFWLWILGAFWLIALRGERAAREGDDRNRHGLLLGATGAIAGFFASSLVNYNFGDGEVALLFWWMMGVMVVVSNCVNTSNRIDDKAYREHNPHIIP